MFVQDIERVLQDAVVTGEIVEILYFGGTQPGTRRDINPRIVDAPHVQAMCLENNAYRTFRIDRMLIAEGVYRSAPKYNANGPPPPHVAFPEFVRRFGQLGFPEDMHPEALDDGVKLYGTRKDGKRRRTPSASLMLAPTGRYVVTTPELGRKTFATLPAATIAFVDRLQLDTAVLAHLITPSIGAESSSPPPIRNRLDSAAVQPAWEPAAAPPSNSRKRTQRPWWWWASVVMIGFGFVRVCVEVAKYFNASL